MKQRPVPVQTDLLRLLLTARKSRGLTQAAVGERAGIPQAQLSRIERGLSDPQLSTLQNIAGALDLQLVLIPRALAPVVKALVEDFGETKGERRVALDEDLPLYRIEAEESPGDQARYDVIE